MQIRSVSALLIKSEFKPSSLTPDDKQRLKNVRRHEPAHVQTGPGAKTSKLPVLLSIFSKISSIN